jgi:hypothetical protein
MIVLPRAYAATRRPIMTDKTDARIPLHQLRLHLPALAAPPLEGVTRSAVVRLLAQLLISAHASRASSEGSDERR